MISIPRSWAREWRAVFRRLGKSRSGLAQAVRLTVRNNLLIAQSQTLDGAAEFEHHCPGPNATLVVPLDALADCESKSDDLVTMQPISESEVELRWTQNGVPQVRTYSAPEVKTVFPEPPTAWTENPNKLLQALDDAVATAAQDATRYALDHVQLRGSAGEVIGTDSKQLLIQGGFAFPWQDAVVVPRIGLSAVKALPRSDAVHVGRTDDWVWIRTGPWSLALPIGRDMRFPPVRDIIPPVKADATRLTLDPADGEMLQTVLPDLPGADESIQPVTVDLNGTVALRAKSASQAQATELVLARSRFTGPATRFVMDRMHLSRARKLGFTGIDIVSPSRPLVFRNGKSMYVTMPGEEKSAIPPSDDVLRVGEPVRTSVANAKAPIPESLKMPAAARTVRMANANRKTVVAHPKRSSSTPSPIEEAVAIQADLRAVLGRVRGLSALIRRQRQHHRLVKQTLDSLKQLQGVGA
jgi:hypothetical protein